MNKTTLPTALFIIGTGVSGTDKAVRDKLRRMASCNCGFRIVRRVSRGVSWCWVAVSSCCSTNPFRLHSLKPSCLIMLHLSASCTYYLYSGVTDMRKGFDGLCGITQSQMSLNALSGAVFIFMNRRRTQVKLLLWEGDGFAIYYKRLEKGTYEQPLISGSSATVSLDARQLQFILQGVSLKKISYRPRLQKSA